MKTCSALLSVLPLSVSLRRLSATTATCRGHTWDRRTYAWAAGADVSGTRVERQFGGLRRSVATPVRRGAPDGKASAAMR